MFRVKISPPSSTRSTGLSGLFPIACDSWNKKKDTDRYYIGKLLYTMIPG